MFSLIQMRAQRRQHEAAWQNWPQMLDPNTLVYFAGSRLCMRSPPSELFREPRIPRFSNSRNTAEIWRYVARIYLREATGAFRDPVREPSFWFSMSFK